MSTEPKVETPVVWRELRELTAELYRCDLCGEQATAVHFVPWVGNDCERVLFACGRHDPGGYWIEVARLLEENGRLRRHIEGKTDFDKTTPDRRGGYALLCEREWHLTNPVVRDESEATA